MNSPIKRACVIGWPVHHSVSPVLHTHWLKEYGIAGDYSPLAVKPEDFNRVVADLPRMGFVGANVTIPHKEAAFALAATLDDDARATGAVNVLVFANDTIHGRNTDGVGFASSLKESLGADAAKRGPAVVLGAGGAARAVVLALQREGAPQIRLVNRTKTRADALAASFDRQKVTVHEWGSWEEIFSGAELLVNTTSLGMKGKDALVLPLDNLPKSAAVADIVYNPLQTDLLARAKARGHATVDGLGMLMHQAVPAFAAWFGITPNVTPDLRAALIEALGRG